ncbi:hypothetical protein MASR2M79_03010 [Aminivibrio sp.]
MRMMFLSGSARAAWEAVYLIGNTIAQLGTEKMKDINFTAVTGRSIKNCINLGTKDVELGMVQSSTVNDAWNGTGTFKGAHQDPAVCHRDLPHARPHSGEPQR